MATVPITSSLLEGQRSLSVYWSPLTQADTDGAAWQAYDYPDKTVAITGTFDGATVTLQGSLDGSNWFSLTDPQGNAIAKTAAAMEAVSENPYFIRPLVTSAGASTAITVAMLATGVRR